MKRIFDFSIGLMLDLAVTVYSFLIMLLVRASLGSPILLSQPRPRLHGETFTKVEEFRDVINALSAEAALVFNVYRLPPLWSFLIVGIHSFNQPRLSV